MNCSISYNLSSCELFSSALLLLSIALCIILILKKMMTMCVKSHQIHTELNSKKEEKNEHDQFECEQDHYSDSYDPPPYNSVVKN